MNFKEVVAFSRDSKKGAWRRHRQKKGAPWATTPGGLCALEDRRRGVGHPTAGRGREGRNGACQWSWCRPEWRHERRLKPCVPRPRNGKTKRSARSSSRDAHITFHSVSKAQTASKEVRGTAPESKSGSLTGAVVADGGVAC